jgi:DNA repair protein RecN (Recombination protein N)
MTNAQARREQLEAELDACRNAYMTCANELTEKRKACALMLQSRVLDELSQLGLEKSRFEVAFTRYNGETPLAGGLDGVEFMLSTNPGEPLKPLEKVASGGELSRIMLAFKAILADKDAIPTLIFDEIDTGISGKIGGIVGEKMMKIASGHQVICITHLPQIAALADSHFLVEKTDDGENTRTNVRLLDEAERSAQIAQMMGGENSELARQHARELITGSGALKARLRNKLLS